MTGDTGVFATVLTLDTPKKNEVFSKLSTKIWFIMVHDCLFIVIEGHADPYKLWLHVIKVSLNLPIWSNMKILS